MAPSLITVLLIGGSQPDVEFLQEMCTLSGWVPSFTIVRDAPSAIALVAGFSEGEERFPHLIILDLDAMRSHAHDLLVLIRARRGTSCVPVVVLTDIQDARERERCLSLGAVAHMLKPTRLDEAERLIHELKSFVPS